MRPQRNQDVARLALRLLVALLLSSVAWSQSQHGTLVTNDGTPILDTQLEQMLEEFIPSFHSNLLLFTQCYGGNFLDDFASWENTVVFASNEAGELAYYGGYDDDAAHALFPRPGRTSDDVHSAGTAGKSANETPVSSGGTVSLADTDPDGPIKSRHVLIYAGEPAPLDELMATDIFLNFRDEANTTVTTVMGDGSKEEWDHPATLAGLRAALAEIGEQMNADEQFILFVTDHGGHSDSAGAVSVADGDFQTVNIETTASVIGAMGMTDANDGGTGFMLFLPNDPGPSFDVNDLFLTPNFADDFNPASPIPFDLNDDGSFAGPGEGHGLFFAVPESTILESIGPDGVLQIGIFNDTGSNLMFDRASLESGPLPPAGFPDLALTADGSFSADVSLSPGDNDVVVHVLELLNEGDSETISVDRITGSAALLDGPPDIEHQIQRLALHHDVNGDGELDDGDELLSELRESNEPTWEAMFPSLDLPPGGGASLITTIDLRGHPADGFFDITYTHRPGASTCDESIPTYTVPAEFRVQQNGQTIIEVLFPDAPEPISGPFDPEAGTYSGVTPFVPAGPGLEASEEWEFTLVDPSGFPLRFDGSSEVTFRMPGSEEPYCRRSFDVEGRQLGFSFPP